MAILFHHGGPNQGVRMLCFWRLLLRRFLSVAFLHSRRVDLTTLYALPFGVLDSRRVDTPL